VILSLILGYSLANILLKTKIALKDWFLGIKQFSESNNSRLKKVPFDVPWD
jgi:hypothetical protein